MNLYGNKKLFEESLRELVVGIHRNLQQEYKGQCEDQIKNITNSIFDAISGETDPRLSDKSYR